MTLNDIGNEDDEWHDYTIEYQTTITVTARSETTAINEAVTILHASEGDLSIVDKELVEPISGPSVTCKFHPQRWHGDYARSADPRGMQTWNVPLEDALDEDGHLVEDNKYSSDELRYHDRAPLWVRIWDGPFYVTIEDINDLPEGESV